jgi:hypothetical protein
MLLREGETEILRRNILVEEGFFKPRSISEQKSDNLEVDHCC